jgi:hypothetical protein
MPAGTPARLTPFAELSMLLPLARSGAMRVVRAAPVVGALAALTTTARTQAATVATPDTSVRVTFGAFVDGYYAWDIGRPPTRDRSFAGGALFTTQPSRHNEFNVNLAFAEAVLTGPRVRGRLALQAGTSVQANYSVEPSEGTVSGPSLAQLLQEAVAGYRIADAVWVDAGIFFSHMGMESWISRDNPTYTRSLTADYSPYYSTGAKLTWAATSRLTARVDVVNGWQNVSEANDGKGVGIRLDYAPHVGATLSYYNFLSEESGTRLRTFNGVGAKVATGPWTLLGQLDLGTQRRAREIGGTSSWLNTAAIARYQLTPAVGMSGRVEFADDEDGVVLGTGLRQEGGLPVPNAPFHAFGGSLGIDVQPQARLLWRTETRGWCNRGPVFPNGRERAPTRNSGFAVTSLALTF